MTCCGKHRVQWLSAARNDRIDDRRQTPLPSADFPVRAVHFKYLGATGLTVVGPVSGRSYQFFGAGATAAVDPRDAPSVAAVPHLVRVRHP
jgi:hypothetical protein